MINTVPYFNLIIQDTYVKDKEGKVFMNIDQIYNANKKEYDTLLARLAEAFISNTAMLKDLNKLNEKYKYKTYKLARKSYAYTHPIMNEGSLEMEVNIKRMLGLILYGEENAKVSNEIVLIIKKYYFELYTKILKKEKIINYIIDKYDINKYLSSFSMPFEYIAFYLYIKINMGDIESQEEFLRFVSFIWAITESSFLHYHAIVNKKVEIGNTLKMYNEYLTNKDDFKVLNKTDPNSPMERLVASYIIQTDFYIKNKSRLEIIPQFNIGKYIHQIDPYAHIPKYRVDFLVIYKTTDNKEKLVIIEYDGLEYHFNNKNELTKLNIDRNHIEKDIERQKTIELYGYYFLRLNKFNLGEYPVQELDKRLKNIFYKEIEDTAFLKVNDNYRKIENKEFKVCYQCGKTKPIEEFYDNNLTSGVGNKCIECKNNNKKTKESNIKYNHQQNYIKLLDDEKTRRCSQCGKTKPMLEFKRASATSGYGRICNTCIKKCPKCGAKLVKVYNNFGAYYECSNPNCDGRRNKIV